MITRRSIEETVVQVLKESGISNVRRELDVRERIYPVVIVVMGSEDKSFPRSPSTINLTVTVESLLELGLKDHYDLHESVLKTLSVEEKVFRKVSAINPRIIGWISTADGGTLEVDDGEGLPLARSEILANLNAV